MRYAGSSPKILLFSYAFPPMQVQMTPAVFKPMAALAGIGYQVDVLCADSFCPQLSTETSLMPFVNQSFANIHRLKPKDNLHNCLRQRMRVLNHIPDLMASLHRPAYEYLMDIDLSDYQAVMTWSPFHSINAVMARVKKHRKHIPWLAQFSDPWVGNPLEVRRINQLWNYYHQGISIERANYVVHSSAYSLALMAEKTKQNLYGKSAVLPHVYSENLYPQRSKATNEKIILRYLGVLYGRRSPEPLFKALKLLFKRQPQWQDSLQVELIGQLSAEMLQTPAALALPQGMVRHIPSVNYIQSLALMYDADILLLIEADIQKNLFLASKLSDYLGANTPIVGMVPSGSSEDILKQLGCHYAHPRDIVGISDALAKTINALTTSPTLPWCDEAIRSHFKDTTVAQRFGQILEDING